MKSIEILLKMDADEITYICVGDVSVFNTFVGKKSNGIYYLMEI